MPRVMALVGIGVTDQPEQRREQSRVRGAIYDQLPSYRAALDREGVSGGADLLLLGSTDEIENGLLRYVEAGVTDFRLGLYGEDDDEREATRSFVSRILRN